MRRTENRLPNFSNSPFYYDLRIPRLPVDYYVQLLPGQRKQEVARGREKLVQIPRYRLKTLSLFLSLSFSPSFSLTLSLSLSSWRDDFCSNAFLFSRPGSEDSPRGKSHPIEACHNNFSVHDVGYRDDAFRDLLAYCFTALL